VSSPSGGADILVSRRLKVVLWAAAAATAVVVNGPQFVGLARPPAGGYLDFVQEWLSARNVLAGDPAYLPQRESLRRRAGDDVPAFDREMRWNAHPPVAVLVALPFGLITDYRDAHLAWTLATFPLFVLSVLVVARELGVRPEWWHVLPFVALTVTSFPVMTQIGQGQLNFVLLPLLVAGWAADRRGYPVTAGFAFGLATAVKLFPGFVFVYLLFARRWRTLVAGAVACVLANGLAVAVLGADAFTTYAREVVPSLGVFRTSWRNVSLPGFWQRLLNPQGMETLAVVLALASQLAIAGVAARLAWRAKTEADHDRAFAAAMIGMLLASPVAWPHYFLLLLVPAGVLWVYLPPGSSRWLFLALLPLFWIPDTTFAVRALGRERAADIVRFEANSPGVAASLTGLAVFTYALLGLFALVVRTKFAERSSEYGG